MRRIALPFALLALAACGSPADTTSNTWRKATTAPEPRADGFVASDGAHLWVVGGLAASADAGAAAPSARVDVLAIGTNHWSLASALPEGAPKHHLAAALSGGKLHVLGGFDGAAGTPSPVAPKAAAFALEGAAWRRLADAPLARGGATAQAIGGKIYVAGGAAAPDAPPTPELDVYDPAADAWTTGAALPTPRRDAASCAVFGRLAVLGGVDAAGTALAVVEAYDPATNAWERWPDLPTARGGLAALAVGDKCYAVGGASSAPPATLGESDVFDPTSRRWAVLAPMPTPRRGLGLALASGELWAVGGDTTPAGGATALIEAYRP